MSHLWSLELILNWYYLTKNDIKVDVIVDVKKNYVFMWLDYKHLGVFSLNC